MRCVNPNVSEEEEISDSAKHRVAVFPPRCLYSLFAFGPVDARLTTWCLTESGDLRTSEEESDSGNSNAAWLKVRHMGQRRFPGSVVGFRAKVRTVARLLNRTE